jgi:hypothetical protein
MDGERSKRALARIEAALARIEAASHKAGGASGVELAALKARHERLRGAVQDGLVQLDSLIEGAQA